MRNLFIPVLAVTAAIFAAAPVVIAYAPYESTMLLVQKIFYFHVPAWIGMYSALTVSSFRPVWVTSTAANDGMETNAANARRPHSGFPPLRPSRPASAPGGPASGPRPSSGRAAE